MLITVAALILAAILLATVRESEAVPGFSRKYNADCMMCHFPVIPHLNNFGQRFRRMGYRTKIEFNKDQDMTNVNNYLSAKVRAQYSYNNTEGQIEKSQFQFPEASLYYIGPVSRNFSAYAHLLATPTSGGQNIDFHGDFMGVWGTPETMFMFRIGQMHMLSQKGVGGFDRPIGVNIIPTNSSVLTSTSTLTGGSAERYTLDLRQTGAEFAFVHGPGKLALQISNGLNNNGSSNQQIGDIDPQKDFLVYYEHLLGELASGFTLFYYNGTTHGNATPSSLSNEFNYSRLGFDLSQWFQVGDLGFVSLQGGYIRSHDNNPANVGPDIDGNAFYVESDQYITGMEVTFYERFTNIDLNVDRNGNSTEQIYTVGVVKPLQTWVRISADYTYTDNRFTGITSHVALVEFQINY